MQTRPDKSNDKASRLLRITEVRRLTFLIEDPLVPDDSLVLMNRFEWPFNRLYRSRFRVVWPEQPALLLQFTKHKNSSLRRINTILPNEADIVDLFIKL